MIYFAYMQCARTFLNLMANISRDQTVQYIVTMIDDILQVHIHCSPLMIFSLIIFMFLLFCAFIVKLQTISRDKH